MTGLFVVFTLLSIPLFYQVRSDALDSRQEAKETTLAKFFYDILKAFKEPPPDAQFEDFNYNKWRSMQDPECTNCGENDDQDGDGISNKEEADQGRNPNCNEDDEGFDVCQGKLQTETPTTDPSGSGPPPPITYYAKELFHGTNIFLDGSQILFPENVTAPPGTANYDRWDVYWNRTSSNTQFGSSSGWAYRVEVVGESDGVMYCCSDVQVGPLEIPQQFMSESIPDTEFSILPPLGGYGVRIVTTPGFGQPLESYAWDVTIIGIRYAQQGS